MGFEAAYTKGEQWLDELLIYLDKNMDYVIKFVKENMPEVKVRKPEGTYLMWLDFSLLGLSKEELSTLMQKEGKIAFDDGFWFGENGTGFERMNIACPRYMVEEGMNRVLMLLKHGEI